MRISNQVYLSFDDVLIKPKLGKVDSRDDIDTSVDFCGFKLKIPLISAPMQTVTESAMANAMHAAGGLGVLHRFYPGEDDDDYLTIGDITIDFDAASVNGPLAVAKGINRSLTVFPEQTKVVFLDVAHAYSRKVLKWVENFKQEYPYMPLIAGSVATYYGAMALLEAGADGVRVGIGPGHACSTRVQTGAGVPQLSAIVEAADVRRTYPDALIVADGGIRNSGDIVKALAAGADCVMIGRLFAGADEAPMLGQYFGQASADSAASDGTYIEGNAGLVESTGPVQNTIDRLMEGVRSGISYAGATDIKSLQENAEFIVVTQASMIESAPKVGV